MIKTILKPNPKDSLNFIQKNHELKAEKTMLIVIGDCMVDYRGRAQSILDWGERVVMIKQDGNVLVHRPEMREPVNWQPSGAKTSFKIEKNSLIIRSNHKKPPEKMKITFRNLKMISATTLIDKANLSIVGMESDFVNQIVCEPDIIEEGFRINKREKHVKSGMIDLFGYDKNHTPTIISSRSFPVQREKSPEARQMFGRC